MCVCQMSVYKSVGFKWASKEPLRGAGQARRVSADPAGAMPPAGAALTAPPPSARGPRPHAGPSGEPAPPCLAGSQLNLALLLKSTFYNTFLT